MVKTQIAMGLAGLLLTADTGEGWKPQTALDCHPYLEMLDQLRQTYGQVPISGGVLHDAKDPDAGALVVVGTPRGDSWTLIVLTSDGKNACAGTWGSHWQQSLVGRRMTNSLPPDGKPRTD